MEGSRKSSKRSRSKSPSRKKSPEKNFASIFPFLSRKHLNTLSLTNTELHKEVTEYKKFIRDTGGLIHNGPIRGEVKFFFTGEFDEDRVSELAAFDDNTLVFKMNYSLYMTRPYKTPPRASWAFRDKPVPLAASDEDHVPQTVLSTLYPNANPIFQFLQKNDLNAFRKVNKESNQMVKKYVQYHKKKNTRIPGWDDMNRSAANRIIRYAVSIPEPEGMINIAITPEKNLYFSAYKYAGRNRPMMQIWFSSKINNYIPKLIAGRFGDEGDGPDPAWGLILSIHYVSSMGLWILSDVIKKSTFHHNRISLLDENSDECETLHFSEEMYGMIQCMCAFDKGLYILTLTSDDNYVVYMYRFSDKKIFIAFSHNNVHSNKILKIVCTKKGDLYMFVNEPMGITSTIYRIQDGIKTAIHLESASGIEILGVRPDTLNAGYNDAIYGCCQNGIFKIE